MRISQKESNLPFSVSCTGKEDDIFKFVVNIGDVNKFILQNYKYYAKAYDSLYIEPVFIDSFQDLDEESVGKDGFFAPVGDSGNIGIYGKYWGETFETNVSCSIYLTIPKIPLGFDYQILDPVSTYNDKNVWWYANKNYFINNLKIVKSTDPFFEAQYQEDRKYTEKNNLFRQPERIFLGRNIAWREIVDDEDYPGKLYIKIAEVKVEEDIASVIPFFRSNVVNPSRYFRMGAENLRLRRIFVWYCGLEKIKNFESFVRKDREVFFPETFFLTFQQLKDRIVDISHRNVRGFFSNYSVDTLYGQNLQALGDAKELKNPEVFRIAILHKKSVGEKFLFEKVFEDVDIYNRLDDQGFETPMTEQEAFDYVGVTKEFDLLDVVGFKKS